MAFRPAQVHAQQHLRPIGGLGPARAGADRQQGVALVVLTGEEESEAGRSVGGRQIRGVAVDLGQELLVVLFLGEVQQFGGRSGPRFQVAPQCQLRAQALGFAQDLLCSTLVVPEAGRA
jgi:hypothetical protein